MGVLEQIMQMREQGMPDQDIISQLQEQGANPRTINDALNQANIKSAVGNGMEEMAPGMQYNAEDVPVPQSSEKYEPSSQEYADDVYMPQSQSSSLSPHTSEEYAYQEPYAGGQSYAGTDADTMIEIAQQVFSEKIKKLQLQMDDLNEFRAIYQTKTDGIYERLKKMESMIDRLQLAILEKVGSYGQGIESVKKELSMMQDTYGKIVDAIADKRHEHHAQEHPAAEHHNPSPQSRPATHHQTSHAVSKPKRHSKKK